ncbi:hypothetical protein SV7mr_39420 [Stieleria bergensis]|uniref:Hydrogenase maturation protease n=1 Tax=Stieleria bergensis TaxID=2528025 RepID=A0A517SZ24_9BACT|nr:hypothetical protein SV7mr_39420 [Planctomycetes bacterium SV_7m_r]
MNDVPKRIAIIGIGSPHGDDQFGWAVADCLSRRFGSPARGNASDDCLAQPAGLGIDRLEYAEGPKARSFVGNMPPNKRLDRWPDGDGGTTDDPALQAGLGKPMGRWPAGEICIFKCNNPIDVIPMLDDFDRVASVDAGVGLPTETPFRRLNYADAVDRQWMASRPVRGTHDFGLHQTLQLAQTLGKRIDHVEIWVGNAIAFDPMSKMTQQSAAAVRPCVDAIAEEWCRARTIAG